MTLPLREKWKTRWIVVLRGLLAFVKPFFGTILGTIFILENGTCLVLGYYKPNKNGTKKSLQL